MTFRGLGWATTIWLVAATAHAQGGEASVAATHGSPPSVVEQAQAKPTIFCACRPGWPATRALGGLLAGMLVATVLDAALLAREPRKQAPATTWQLAPTIAATETHVALAAVGSF